MDAILLANFLSACEKTGRETDRHSTAQNTFLAFIVIYIISIFVLNADTTYFLRNDKKCHKQIPKLCKDTEKTFIGVPSSMGGSFVLM